MGWVVRSWPIDWVVEPCSSASRGVEGHRDRCETWLELVSPAGRTQVSRVDLSCRQGRTYGISSIPKFILLLSILNPPLLNRFLLSNFLHLLCCDAITLTFVRFSTLLLLLTASLFLLSSSFTGEFLLLFVSSLLLSFLLSSC
jgi:hypothetical protein